MKALPLVLALSVLLAACSGDDNDDEVRDLNNRVDDLEARLDVAEMDNTDLADSLDAIEERLDAIENDTSVADELAEISDLLDEIEERLGLIEAQVASEYEVRIVNVMFNQPVAPTAVILHEADYYGWQIGSPASLGLETLAESGAPVDFMAEAEDALDTAAAGSGPYGPSAAVTASVSAVWRDDLSLTIAGMPVNTNDAFSGVTGWNIAGLETGDSVSRLLPIYDAGTEANTETAETVPGPAAGGEGFNAARDDLADLVSRHSGVVTADDGLSTSALNESHRFDQGGLFVTVTRVE